MSKQNEELKKLFDRRLQEAGTSIFYGKVTAVNPSARTCTVEISGIPYENVLLYAIENEALKGFYFTPSVDSYVLVQQIGGDRYCIEMFSVVDKVQLSIGENVELSFDKDTLHYKNDQVTMTVTGDKVEISSPEISFNSGSLGGLVKIKELTDKLNALIDAFNGHTHQILPGGIAVTGSPSAQSNAAPVSVPAITGKHAKVKVSDYENEKVKH